MSEQIKKGLKKIWNTEPVTFPGFSYVKQVEVEKLLEKMPARYDKKPEYMLVEPLTTVSKKNHVIKDREKSENASLLCLNSGDNDKAECLATYIEDHHKRSIDWVSFTIYLQITIYFQQTQTDNYIYLNTYPV